MPIYGYRCSSCGHQKDVLQKISDPVLTTCPSCGQEDFSKQVSAPNFQLKGTGWYVTDFRDGNKGKKADGNEKESAQASSETPDKSAGADSSDSKAAAGTAASTASGSDAGKSAPTGSSD
ncbi:MAG: zinc ribbon domain-containing protein, partial [Burkholderiaceae bacterium]